MAGTLTNAVRRGVSGRKHLSSRSGWGGILAALGVLILFLYVIGPLGLQMDFFKPLAEFIQEHNINANAYYYSEVDEFYEAERHMREYLALVPGAKHSPR